MKPEIEQIAVSDEAARITVQQAEQEAGKIKAEAKVKAESMLAALDKQVQEIEDREIVPILTEARRQAQLTRTQAEQYIEKLKKRLPLLETKIAADCILKVG